MHTFKRIAVLAASFILGVSAFTGCGHNYSATVDTVDVPILTVTITEPVTETETESADVAEIETKITIETEAETDVEIITETEESEKNTDEAIIETASEEGYPVVDDSYVVYHFRSKKLLNQHFEKHGAEFDGDFDYRSAEDYETGASDVINNEDALFKYEKEDGDGVYYIEDTNEFVILSKDGYIRTYFRPSSGKKYFDKQ